MNLLIPRLRKVLAAARPMLAFLVLPNALFWAAGHIFDTLPRATINVDYLLVGALVPYIGFGCGIALMFLAVLADVFRASGSLYYFSQRDAVASLQFLGELPLIRVVTVSILAAVLILLWSGLLVRLGRFQQPSRPQTVATVVVIVMLATVAVWGGNSSLRLRDDTAVGNIASSSGLAMAKNVFGALMRKHDRLPVTQIDSATRQAGWLTSPPTDRNLVLVLLESWGHAPNANWDELVTAGYNNPEVSRHYDVQQGTVSFRGSTVPGEFRELCGVASAVMERPTDDTEAMHSCLPYRLGRAGTKSTFIHGFDGNMFNRSNWSGSLGFQELLFRRELLQLSIRKCEGPFSGACDDDVVRFIGDQLTQHRDKKQFVYFLTINSHLPVQRLPGTADPLGCRTDAALVADDATCDLLDLVARVHLAIAELAKRTDLPKTEFLIVGDHAPPFLYKSRREQFSQTHVPFIRLVPKTK